MKRLLHLPFASRCLLLALVFISGCKQDFDITANYKEVPVVYGLLNWKETTHYIRIQKGYLIDGNANVAAGISDSIYYPDVLTVQLIPYSTLNGNQSGAIFTLSRVNGNDIGLPKESGIFASDSNILYTFNGTIDPNKRYALKVTNNSNSYIFKTQKVNNVEGIPFVKDFQINTPSKAAKLPLQNNSPAKIVFVPAENAGIYDLKIRFYYREYNQSDNALLKDTFAEILLLKSYMADYSSNNIVGELSATNVIGYLSSHLEHSNSIYREFNEQKGIQVIVAAGGSELTTYLNSQAAQGGLASNEALPPYTNIEGGQGLLSSRYYKQVDSVLLSDRGLDSLACGPLSSGLRFKNRNGLICN